MFRDVLPCAEVRWGTGCRGSLQLPVRGWQLYVGTSACASYSFSYESHTCSTCTVCRRATLQCVSCLPVHRRGSSTHQHVAL